MAVLSSSFFGWGTSVEPSLTISSRQDSGVTRALASSSPLRANGFPWRLTSRKSSCLVRKFLGGGGGLGGGGVGAFHGDLRGCFYQSFQSSLGLLLHPRIWRFLGQLFQNFAGSGSAHQLQGPNSTGGADCFWLSDDGFQYVGGAAANFR